MITVFKRRIGYLFALVLLGMLLTAGQAIAAETNTGNDILHLQILMVNDFHGALTEDGKNPGAAKLVQFLQEAARQNPDGTILISAGDMFEGTPDSNLLYGKTVVDIMNYAKLDVMTLGNHEFDWGLEKLKERMTQAKFSYVCANIIDKNTAKPVNFIDPYIILERGGLKIAVIGIATPETAYKTNPRVVSGYAFADPVKTVDALLPEIKRQGADIAVVVTHLASSMDAGGVINGDAAALALQAHGIDAVISGHSHQTVYGKVNGVPVVQAYYNGRAVGKIEMLFNKRSRRVEGSTVSVAALPYPGLTADAEVQATLDKAQTEIAPFKNVVVGQTVRTLSHDRNQLSETLLGQWVTDIMRKTADADIAFQNAGGLRTDISAGAITMGNLYEVLPFDNTLYTVEMTGRQIMSVLEYGIMNDNIGMVQYSGIKVAYCAAGPRDGRIAAVTMSDGTELQLDKIYKVVTNDFMVNGGDGFTMFSEGQNLHDTCIPIRDVLADTIRNQKVIDFSGDDRWNLMNSCGQRQKEAA